MKLYHTPTNEAHANNAPSQKQVSNKKMKNHPIPQLINRMSNNATIENNSLNQSIPILIYLISLMYSGLIEEHITGLDLYVSISHHLSST